MCQASEVLRNTVPERPTKPESSSTVRRPPRSVGAQSRVVLLGTAGGSNPKATRFGYANAVVVGDAAYIVDCGEGAHKQAWRAGISMHLERRPPGGATVRNMFFTHLHSDHVIDYANFWLGFWPTHDVHVFGPGEAGLPIPAYPPSRTPPLVVPDAPTPGLTKMTEALYRAFAYNINVRIADEDRPDVTQRIHTHEIGVTRPGYVPQIDVGVVASGLSVEAAAPTMQPFEVLPTDEHGVRVSAILVQHAPVFPALGYRIDTPTGSVVFSGDTGPCDNVVRLAEGADVLVHEAIDIEYLSRRVAKMPNRDAIIAHLVSSHTSPEDAGRIAQRAGVKTLVLSHLVPGDNEISESEWEGRARSTFSGEVVCGVDLDEFALTPPS
jgi:ribonuclease BN (tRNA processing enzyme)